MKIMTTGMAAAALVLGLLAGAFPSAALSGFHASYFSESSFLLMAPGDTGQFAVGYTNTGDQAWVRGVAGQQASLATAAPLDNTRDFDAGWAVNWASPNRYSAQTSDLVAPGQTGFFVYNIKVPTAAPTGLHQFFGRPVIDGVTWLEDFGYYQIANVQASGITITGTSPASPSTNPTPTVNGTGAPAGAAVTMKDGSSTVGSGTATSSGTFAITTSALAAGSHTLTACSTNGCSAGFTYVVDTTAPSVTGATAPNVSQVVVSFSEAMNCAEIATAANFAVRKTVDATQTVAVNTATANSGCTAATLSVSPMANGTQYTVVVNNVHDQAGNLINGSANSANFTVSDTTRPTATGASFPSPSTLQITYSKPMATSGAASITAQGNYNFDSVNGATAFTGAGTANADATAVTFTLASSPPSTGTHTVDIFNVQDTAGNVINPNPSTLQVTFTPNTTRPTVTSVSATTASTVLVTFSTVMKCTTGSTAGDNAGNAANYTVQLSNGSAGPTVAAAACGTATNGNTTATLTLGTPLTSGQSYNLLTRNVQDQFGNVVNPNPTSTPFTFTADTTRPTVVATSTTGQTQFTVTYSEPMMTGGGANAIDNKANYTSTDAAFNAAIAAGSCAANAAATAATCTVATQTGGKPLSIANVHDISNNDINPDPTTATLTFVDTTPPTVTNASGTHGTTSDTVVVTYSEAMNTTGGATGATSVTNPANYRIDGNALPAGAVLTCNSTSCTVVTISSLPNTTIAPAGSAHSVTVSGVTDTSGNTITPNPTTRAFITQ